MKLFQFSPPTDLQSSYYQLRIKSYSVQHFSLVWSILKILAGFFFIVIAAKYQNWFINAASSFTVGTGILLLLGNLNGIWWLFAFELTSTVAWVGYSAFTAFCELFRATYICFADDDYLRQQVPYEHRYYAHYFRTQLALVSLSRGLFYLFVSVVHIYVAGLLVRATQYVYLGQSMNTGAVKYDKKSVNLELGKSEKQPESVENVN